MSSIKSPEHQQGPTSLAPSNSGRRKEAATPEGECGSLASAFPPPRLGTGAGFYLPQLASPVNVSGCVKLLLSLFFRTPFREKEGHFRK